MYRWYCYLFYLDYLWQSKPGIRWGNPAISATCALAFSFGIAFLSFLTLLQIIFGLNSNFLTSNKLHGLIFLALPIIVFHHFLFMDKNRCKKIIRYYEQHLIDKKTRAIIHWTYVVGTIVIFIILLFRGLIDPNASQKNSNGNTGNNSNTTTNANTAIGSTSATNQGNVNVRNSNVTVNNGVNTNSQQSASNANSNSNVNPSQPSKAQQWNAQTAPPKMWNPSTNPKLVQQTNANGQITYYDKTTGSLYNASGNLLVTIYDGPVDADLEKYFLPIGDLGGLARLGRGLFTEIEESALDISRRDYLNAKFGRTGNLNNDINFRGYLEKSQSLDVATDSSQAIYYSGRLNRIAAVNYADQIGGTILEMTPGGIYLQNENLYSIFEGSEHLAQQIWANLSSRYAQLSSGDVYVFGQGARSESILKNIELPILETNLNVTNIINMQPIEQDLEMFSKYCSISP